MIKIGISFVRKYFALFGGDLRYKGWFDLDLGFMVFFILCYLTLWIIILGPLQRIF